MYVLKRKYNEMKKQELKTRYPPYCVRVVLFADLEKFVYVCETAAVRQMYVCSALGCADIMQERVYYFDNYAIATKCSELLEKQI